MRTGLNGNCNPYKREFIGDTTHNLQRIIKHTIYISFYIRNAFILLSL
jgi:hypothetical protein